MLYELVEHQMVDLVSFMDHTPGYGVFQDIDAYRRYHTRSGGSLSEADAFIEQRLKQRENIDENAIIELIKLCHQKGIPVASHDDHTEEKILWAKQQDIHIAEFPVNRETVNAARENHLYTVFGAANMVRGGSHAENLNAAEMVTEGLADILCSDYSPMSLLRALFQSKAECSRPLQDVVPLVTQNPARALGLNDFGAIEEGKAADLILVRMNKDKAHIALTIVNGKIVYICPDYDEMIS
jgi:alpha-D-ribose 1-methylphosphonate 5-triphosphate diphosphatase